MKLLIFMHEQSIIQSVSLGKTRFVGLAAGMDKGGVQMEKLRIFAATETDIPFIAEVYEKNIHRLHGVKRDESTWKQLLSNKDSSYFIVTADEPVAWFRTEIEDGIFWLGMLQVKPDYQRRGVGRAVLSAAEHMAREQGFTAVGIHTTEDNLAARALYAHCGYAVTEVGPCTTADGVDRVGYTYEKGLT